MERRIQKTLFPRWFITLAAILLVAGPLVGAAGQKREESSFDVILLGGRVLDGSGNPWFRADVGIRGDRIAAIGQLDGFPAKRVIDVQGKVVVPGFIDLHSHADGPGGRRRGLRSEDARRRAAPNLVSQGITTVAVNQDGRSPWPIAEQRAELEQKGTGPNVILLVGHGTVRRQVMGDDFRRPATPDEIEKMRQLVRQGMEEGAYGLSAGLEYVPGRWSTTEELVALVNVLAPFGGVFISHQRSEGADPMWYWPSQHQMRPPTLLDAVRETIEIGRRTGVPVVASHIKAKGAHYWGSSHAAIRLITEARARGIEIWADQYPYTTTGSDGNTVLIPRWAFGQATARPAPQPSSTPPDYAARLDEVLADPAQAEKLKQDIAHEIARRGGPEHIVVFEYPDHHFIGKTLAELAAARHTSAVEMALILQREGFRHRPGGARLRGFSLWEGDVEAYAAQPWTATATDGGIALPEDGPVHARFYGTFPRKIRRYALEKRVISIEQAIRSATSLPAQILRLWERGLVRQGFYADLVVLDVDRVRDRATFFQPHQYAEGVDYVFINGRLVVDRGKLTWALPGKVLTPHQR